VSGEANRLVAAARGHSDAHLGRTFKTEPWELRRRRQPEVLDFTLPRRRGRRRWPPLAAGVFGVAVGVLIGLALAGTFGG